MIIWKRYTSGSNPTGMGCVLPWCSNYCSYIRSVCLETYDGKTYVGSRSFSYPIDSIVTVNVYEMIGGSCDFGGIEGQEE